MRRGDIRKLQIEVAAEDAAAKKQAKAEAAAAAVGGSAAAAAASNTGRAGGGGSGSGSGSGAGTGGVARSNIPAIEVKRRLRVLAEPITLFGESDDERLERLKLVEVKHHERAQGSMGRKAEYLDIAKQV